MGLLFAAPSVAMAQVYEEKITKELTFEKKSPDNTLMIFNLNGDVKVEGYSGDKIVIEVNKKIRAKTEERLTLGKTEIQLGVLDRADTLMLYVAGVCTEFGKTPRNQGNGRRWGGYGYNWNCGGGNCNKPYDYAMDFTIRVPANVNVLASTINDGDIDVQNVSSFLHANNVNGHIRLRNISGRTEATTVNGDVDLDYSKNPTSECRYYTLNGDINAFFVKGLAANVAFESFNGDFYTNVNELETMPLQVQRNDTGKGMKYKLGGSLFKVGKGGVFLDFETFNGDVILKEKQ